MQNKSNNKPIAPLDPVLLKCVEMCDKEIDILIEDGRFGMDIEQIRYLYGDNYYDKNLPRKFNKKFVKFLMSHSKHKRLFGNIYLG